MGEEEQAYVIEQLDKLIRLADDVTYHRMEGPHELYLEAVAALEKQRKHILAMDGIEL